MPELPEIETICRGLNSTILNHKIIKAEFLSTALREPIDIETCQKVLSNQVIHEVFRRSKYIIIRSSKGFCFIHLGMSGQFFKHESDIPVKKHTHMILHTQEKNKKSYFHYVDPRRFGRIASTLQKNWESYTFFKKLGPEPLSTKKLDDYLWQQSKKRRLVIKNFLMNAEIVVGIGNIYACEILFDSKIHPLTFCHKLNLSHYHSLTESIKKILNKAIEAGGTTIKDFVNMTGSAGYFSQSLHVYGLEGTPCSLCTASISRIVQGNRSTFFCPMCQK